MESPLSIEQIKKGRPLTYREARYVKARIEGKNVKESMQAAGFSPGFCHTPHELPGFRAMNAEVDRLQAELSAHTIEQALVDAKEIHEQLTEELRGDIADLYDEKGELLPVKDWPLWARNGGVEVLDEPKMVHSTDGKNSSWDVQGRQIKVRMGPRHKTRELAMKHRGVNAMVDQKAGDVNLTIVHNQILQKLDGALARKKALDETRNVTPR